MAGRRNKVGLDYFELDCHMDDKIKLIEAEFGLKGFAIVIKLLQHIYAEEGYYCEWTPDTSLLWAMQLGISPCGDGNKGFGTAVATSLSDPQGKLGTAVATSLSGYPNNLINRVVAASIRRDIFSREIFEKYRILTSSGIQKRYLRAASRRGKIELKKEYLLISVPENEGYVVINSIYVNKNEENVDRNAQRREEKNIKDLCAPEMHDEEPEKVSDSEQQLKKDFEIIYGIYPKKKGKTVAFANYKLWVGSGKYVGNKRYKLTNRQIYLAVRKYVRQQEEAGKDLEYWKNFDTLMGRQLLDYVEEET